MRAQRSNLVDGAPSRPEIAASPGGLLAMTASRLIHRTSEPGHKVRSISTNSLGGVCCNHFRGSTLTSVGSLPVAATLVGLIRCATDRTIRTLGLTSECSIRLAVTRIAAGQPDGYRRSEFLKALGSDLAVLAARLRRSLSLVSRRPAPTARTAAATPGVPSWSGASGRIFGRLILE